MINKIPKIKAGNDIPVVFTICDGGLLVDFNDASDVQWSVRNEQMVDQRNRTQIISIDNPVKLIVSTSEYDTLGVYFVGVSYMMDGRRYVVDAPAFELVMHTPVNACSDPENPVCICAKTEISDVGIRGIPVGGTPGQVLTKTGDADFESGWTTIEVPTKVSQLENDAQYTTEPWVENGYLSKSEAEALQPRITTTEDLALSPMNVLSLTSKAKERLFIDMWNKACRITSWNKATQGYYGRYNEESGLYELNGLTDITYDEALQIYEIGYLHAQQYLCGKVTPSGTVRTVFPVIGGTDLYINDIGKHLTQIEVVRLLNHAIIYLEEDPDTTLITCYRTEQFFAYSSKLRKILGIIKLTKSDFDKTHFWGCNFTKIEEIWLNSLIYSVNFLRGNTTIRADCLKYMVDHSANTTAISITVHASIYAKLTDPNNAEWYAIHQAAASRNISFVTI